MTVTPYRAGMEEAIGHLTKIMRQCDAALTRISIPESDRNRYRGMTVALRFAISSTNELIEREARGGWREWEAWPPCRIKALRLYRGLTNEAFACAVGITQAELSRWETGREKPNAKSVANLERLERMGAFEPTCGGR